MLVLTQAMADEPAARRRAPAARPVAAAPAPQQTANWTGGQLGSSNGASMSSNNFAEPGSFNCFLTLPGCRETPFAFDDNKSVFTTGVYTGYRWQMGVWVVGVETDVYWKKAQTSKTQNTPPPWLASEVFTGSAQQGWDGSLRGRFGYLVTPFTLVYATGGLAYGEVKGSYSYAGCEIVTPGCVSGSGSWSTTRAGWTIGTGVEVAMMLGWKARLEYRYTDLGKFSENVALTNNYAVCPSNVCGTNARIDLHPVDQKVTFGFGFDF